MGVERRVGKLIEATRELMDKPLVAHACDGGARDALSRKLGHSSDALTFEQGNDAILLGLGFGWHELNVMHFLGYVGGYIRGLVSS